MYLFYQQNIFILNKKPHCSHIQQTFILVCCIFLFDLPLLLRDKQEDVETTIKHRKWKWIGHTLRKVPNNTTSMAMEWNPQGRRSRGRPKQSWRHTVSKELENIGRTWGEAKLLANNKIWWKAMVEALCLSRG